MTIPPKDRGNRRASLADVARLAGVDTSTASRVLNADRNHRMRPETRERVTEAAKTLGYSPNPLARALRTARSFSLGIAVPQLVSPVFEQIIAGAQAAARERGYGLLIAHVPENGAEAFEQLTAANRVDGLLAASLDDDKALGPALENTGVPFVVLNRKAAGITNCIVLDTRAAAYLAVQHLTALGHRRIAHLAGRAGGYNANDRLAGYQDALAAAGIAMDPPLIQNAGYTVEGGAAAMQAILARSDRPPTAVFAATLLSAAGAMSTLRDAGLDVPKDVSIISLHDGILAEVMNPALTTVRLPAREMGYEGTTALIDLIDGRRDNVARVLDQNELVIRRSTAPPRG
ncbi:MAG: LacI family DNA-binding transcriptional regulator [Burkholderiales bacterium]|nr:LacI family DNA-binding transcriptional regulator [Burkholderiales bacterium]